MWIAKQEGGCGSRLHEEIRPSLRTCARQMKDMFWTTKSRIPMDAALHFVFFSRSRKKYLTSPRQIPIMYFVSRRKRLEKHK